MSSQGYFIKQELAGADQQSQAIYHPRVFSASSPVSSTCEHFVLKDLFFYEVARLLDSEAYQTRLEEHERKR